MFTSSLCSTKSPDTPTSADPPRRIDLDNLLKPNIQAPYFGWADLDAERRRYDAAKEERRRCQQSSDDCPASVSDLSDHEIKPTTSEVEPCLTIETDYEPGLVRELSTLERTCAHDPSVERSGREARMLTQAQQLDLLCRLAADDSDDGDDDESLKGAKPGSIYTFTAAKWGLFGDWEFITQIWTGEDEDANGTEIEEISEEEQRRREDLIQRRILMAVEELNRARGSGMGDGFRRRWNGLARCFRRVFGRLS